MFEEIRARVAEGRWGVAGGMWIQPDCNVPSGESFARHFLYSQRFFQERFGVAARTGYNVDSFGHTGALPKLFAGAGIENYIMMRPDKKENPDLPQGLYKWEADDGSQVFVFRLLPGCGYGGADAPDSDFYSSHIVKMMEQAQQHASALGFPVVCLYGAGNHGGGPTKVTIKHIEEFRAKNGGGDVVYARLEDYFARVGQEGGGALAAGLPVWRGDMRHHASGCYSANSEIKRNNQRAETRLAAAEALAALARGLSVWAMPRGALDEAWKDVLFNQFHDVMGGCSVREAYEDARESHGAALRAAGVQLNAAAQSLSWAIDTSGGEEALRTKEYDWSFWGGGKRGTPIVVFNALAWRRRFPVRIERPTERLSEDAAGAVGVPVQRVRASRTNGEDKWDSLFVADVPAFGWRVYWAWLPERRRAGEAAAAEPDLAGCGLEAGERYIENELFRVSASGGGVQIFDKRQDRGVFTEKKGRVEVVDVTHCDTWAHGVFAFDKSDGFFDFAGAEVLEAGPVRARMRVTWKYRKSELRQDYCLFPGADAIRVENWLDWHEKHRLVKLTFPVNVDASSAKPTHGAPFGAQTREPDEKEHSMQMWADVSGAAGDGSTGAYGLTAIATGKYSYDARGNALRLTVANSSQYADHFGQKRRDNEAHFLDQGIQEFVCELVPHAGGWEDVAPPVQKRAYALNAENVVVAETFHKGALPLQYAGIAVDSDNVVVTALKPAYDGGGVVLRAYESAGRETACTIELPALGRTVAATIPAHAVRTWYLPNDPAAPARPVNLYEA